MHARYKHFNVTLPTYVVAFLVFALASMASLFVTQTASAAVNCYANPTAAAVKACQDANPAWINGKTPEEQVKSFLYGQALRGCFNTGTLTGGVVTGHISADDAASGDWFVGGTYTQDAYIGQIIMGSQNESAECNDADGLINAAFSFWGWDKREALCDMGWHRESNPDPAGCRTGSGYFEPPANSGDTRTSAFENALKAKIYGNNQYDLTDHQRYVLYRDTFTIGCAAQPVSAGAVTSGPRFDLKVVDNTGAITTVPYEAKADGDTKYLFVLNDFNTYYMSCSQLVDAANNGLNGRDYVGAYAAFQKIAQESAGGIPGGGSGSVGDTEQDLCDKLGTSSLRWVMCPLFTMMDGATSWIRGAIQGILTVPIDDFFSPGMKSAWSTFRNISLSLLVIAALVMVISQAAGFDFLDAYTVKKILPRLLIAIIGITLSWEIMRFVVQFFNDIGDWIYAIIDSALSVDNVNIPWTQDWYSQAGAVGGVVVAGGAIAAVGGGLFLLAIAPGGIGVILATLGVFLIALLIGLFVLGIRLAVIGVCIIIAPLAIAAYVLPGTKKMWDFWQNTFWTCLIMFPIVMTFMAACSGLASIIGATDTGWSSMMSLIVYFAQFALLPFAFKLSGGLMKTIFSITDDKSRGPMDRLRKMRSKGFGKTTQHYGENLVEKRADWQSNLQTKASRTDTSGRRVRMAKMGAWAVGGGKYGNIEAQASAIRAHRSKEMSEQIATGIDNEIRALSVAKTTADNRDRATANAARLAGRTDWTGELSRVQDGVKQYKSLAGAWVKEAEVDAAYKRWGGDTFAQQKSLSYEMNKASAEKDVQSVGERYADLAQNAWHQTDNQAGGTWIGAAYENQNKHRQLKSMNWKSGDFADRTTAGTKDYTTSGAQAKMKKFADEVHQNLGAYPLAQMNSETVRQLKEAYENLDGSASSMEAKQKIQGIAETFVHDMSAGVPGSAIPGEGGKVEAVLPGEPGTGRAGGRIVTGSGAAAVNERVRELASLTGVKWKAPDQGTPPSPLPPITTPPQN